jgi:hypothetical protein
MLYREPLPGITTEPGSRQPVFSKRGFQAVDITPMKETYDGLQVPKGRILGNFACNTTCACYIGISNFSEAKGTSRPCVRTKCSTRSCKEGAVSKRHNKSAP